MKKQTKAFSSSLIIGTFFRSLTAIILISFLHSFEGALAQQTTKSTTQLTDPEDLATIEYLKANGATQATIDKWIKDRKAALDAPKGFFQNPNYKNPKYPVTSAVGTCADMGGESGWSAWEAATGFTWYPNGGTPTITVTGQNPASLPPRFGLTSAGTNSCTPGGGGPALPFVAPGFGNTSIQLGATGANGNMNQPYPTCNSGPTGGCVERLTYNLLVQPSDTNFTYAYAVVLENPCNGIHTSAEVPFAEIFMLDPQGDTVPCSYQKYMGDTTGKCTPPPTSGMYKASCSGPGGMDVSYQPWTQVTLNLAAYIGQIIQVVITNADCAKSVHYCYSYWDFQCAPPTASVIPVCMGQQATITGPNSPGSTYTWYQNHQLYTGTPSPNSQTITPIPVNGDTFSVAVVQPGGCKFWMTYVPQGSTITPAFSYTPSCGSAGFNDISSVSPATPANTVTAWNWQLPGGTPSSSSSQNPSNVQYPPGTYTATLEVTSSAGCKNTISHVFTVAGLSTSVTASPMICGAPGSANITTSTGTAPYTYSWSPSGGNSANATGLNAGTYTVLTTDATGCQKSDIVTVTSTSVMNAAVNNSTICSGQGSTLTASGGANYIWSTGETTASIMPPTATSASYSVIVWSGGCKDTVFASLTVNPSPTVALGADQTICTGQNATFDAGNPGASYLWSTGATTQTVNVYLGGSYWVIVAFSNCLAKDTIQTFTAPAIHLTDISLCSLSPMTLDPGSGATSYLWNNGATSQMIDVDVAGDYWVEVTYGNCKSSDTATVTGDGNGGTLYVPNAFTPNGDNLNEIFAAKGTGIATFEMSVFDRWGNRIFASDDLEKGWNGKIEGHYTLKSDGRETAQEDVYIWKIDYTTQCFPDRVMKEMGMVSILK